MKNFKILGISLYIFLLVTSCNNSPSLQSFIVESKENNEYIAIDLPASIISIKESEITDELKTTLATIKKMNFVALQISESNKEFYELEKQKVKTILKNPDYKELIKMNSSGTNVVVSYLGEEDAINEVVIFGADENRGLAVIRVTGEKMNPSDIFKIAQYMNIDSDNSQLKALGGILGGIK